MVSVLVLTPLFSQKSLQVSSVDRSCLFLDQVFNALFFLLLHAHFPLPNSALGILSSFDAVTKRYFDSVLLIKRKGWFNLIVNFFVISHDFEGLLDMRIKHHFSNRVYASELGLGPGVVVTEGFLREPYALLRLAH